jgi:hypothetical protein
MNFTTLKSGNISKHMGHHSNTMPQNRYRQKLHSRVKSVPECQPTSGVAAMLKATKPEEIL